MNYILFAYGIPVTVIELLKNNVQNRAKLNKINATGSLFIQAPNFVSNINWLMFMTLIVQFLH